MIPPFNPVGLLPAGIHNATWQEVQAAFGWNAQRVLLLRKLYDALVALKAAGCPTVYLDGSFVTSKDLPNDYDACWSVAGVNLAALDPVFLDFSRGRAQMKAKYLGDLFPAEMPEGGTGRLFRDFFQMDRSGAPKGIISISLLTLP
jgi:hypothetical protein